MVDGSPNPGTVVSLTHWPRIATPPDTEADLSAQMAFRYLDRGAALPGEAELVTNNHFEQDGLVAVPALSNPDHALGHRDLLEDLAAAGDFGTYWFREAARLSMVVHAFADPGRSPVAPLAEDPDADLYRELLGRLPELVANPDQLKGLWVDEDWALSRHLSTAPVA